MNLLGTGTTREVYDYGNGLVLKKHTHSIGYKQSLNELTIVTMLPEIFKPHFPKILTVTESYQICEYIQPYTPDSEPPYDLGIIDEPEYLGFTPYITQDGCWNFTPNDEQLFELLNSYDIAIGDLYDSCNTGIRNNKAVFIDFGMTNALLKEADREIQLGNLPSYIEERCPCCNTDTRFVSIHLESPRCTICGTVIDS